MKLILLILAATALLNAQTGVDIKQVRVRSEGNILLVGEGYIVAANIGEGLVIDWSTVPPTLKATQPPSDELSDPQRVEVAAIIAAATLSIALERIVYHPTVPTADFTIPQEFAPSSVRLYSNGLLLAPGTESEGADYQINGSMVHFHPLSVPQAGWTVQLLYRPAG